ncbi:hypothetical protein ACFCYB_35705 [Streptomyces sp. NPDC056309]
MASLAREHRELDALVDMSEMTVSQMTSTSATESHQQRVHWLAEQVLNWSGLPVVHIRPTSFLDNPLFTSLAAQSIRKNGTIELPFGRSWPPTKTSTWAEPHGPCAARKVIVAGQAM